MPDGVREGFELVPVDQQGVQAVIRYGTNGEIAQFRFMNPQREQFFGTEVYAGYVTTFKG